MEEPFVERYIIRIEDNKYLMYDSLDDVEDGDDVIAVRIPESAANMFESLQTSYYIMQNYFDAQWELMERKRTASEDDGTLYRTFAEIVKTNELEEIFNKDKPQD